MISNYGAVFMIPRQQVQVHAVQQMDGFNGEAQRSPALKFGNQGNLIAPGSLVQTGLEEAVHISGLRTFAESRIRAR